MQWRLRLRLLFTGLSQAKTRRKTLAVFPCWPCNRPLHAPSDHAWALTGSPPPWNVKTCPCWPGRRSTRWSGWTASASAASLWRREGCSPPGQEAWLAWGQCDKQVWDLFPTHQGAGGKKKKKKRFLSQNRHSLSCLQKHTFYLQTATNYLHWTNFINFFSDIHDHNDLIFFNLHLNYDFKT